MKKVYMMKTPTFPSDYSLKQRLAKYNFQMVNAAAKHIDIVVIKDTNDIKKHNRLAKIVHNFSPEIIDIDIFLGKLGFSPDERFINWQQYPNYDPWTGDKINIWNDSLVDPRFK